MPDKVLYKPYDFVYVLGRDKRLINYDIGIRHKPRYGNIRKLCLRIVPVKDVIMAVQGLKSRPHLDKMLLLRFRNILLKRVVRPSNRYGVTA
jgi:hypothetical protein